MDVSRLAIDATGRRMQRLLVAALAFTLCLALSGCASADHLHGARVVSLHRHVDTTAYDHAACADFWLTAEQVRAYFAAAKQVDGFEFHDKAIIAPCSYSGNLIEDGKTATWVIFAAGAGRLYDDQGLDRRYLCENACCRINAEFC